ncbi:MAG: HEAT repeat domain-containing protein [Planctomycetes bacterium]|nr:HEAT repeat domain-containing protein [Planctomycetota bacterium]
MHGPIVGLNGLVVAAIIALAPAGAVAQEAAASREQELLTVIRSETPEADKALAFKGLAVHGSPACVADVVTYLGNERLASWARIAMEAIPGAEASAALRAAAVADEKLDSRLRVGIINSIGVRRDAAAVPLLAARLGDSDPKVATAAAAALGKIGTPDAGQALLQALAEGKPAREDVAEACVVCGEGLVVQGNSAAAMGLFDVVRRADVSEQRRAEAARAAILVRGRNGLPLLTELLQSPVRRLFNMGLSTARELTAGADRDAALAYDFDLAILKSLAPAPGSDAQGTRRRLLIELLADRNVKGASAAVRQALLDAARDPSAHVRGAAIRAISRCGDASSAAGLLEIAAAGPEVAAAVRQSLATMSADGVDDVILARLADGDAARLPLVIGLVGDRRIVAAADRVLPLADHPEAGVRTAALAALGSIVDLKNLRTLVAKVTAPRDDAEAQAAAAALKEAAVRMADREGCAAVIAEGIGSAGGRTVVLVETLADVGGGKALATVAAAARSADPAIQDAATRVLGKWMTADAAPVLLDLATSDAAGSYRGRAYKGYVRIARQFALPETERAEMCRRALAAAREPADRKAVIEILVRYPHAATLAVAREAAALPDVADEAGAAITAIEGKMAAAAGRP